MFRRGEGEHQQESPIDAREVGMADGGSEVTVVGKGARLEGTIVSAGSLRIDGQVKGKITADGDVALSATSQVEADVQGKNVTVGGAFKGAIVARGKAELARGGRVDGNITSTTLIVAEGALFTGQSIMGQQAEQSARQNTSRGLAQSPPPGERQEGRSGEDGRATRVPEAEKAAT